MLLCVVEAFSGYCFKTMATSLQNQDPDLYLKGVSLDNASQILDPQGSLEAPKVFQK